MASFGLLAVFSGFEFDLPHGVIGFNPKREKNQDFKCFFSIATGFGSVEVSDKSTVITLTEGKLTVKYLHLPYLDDGEYTLCIDGEERKTVVEGGNIELFKAVSKNITVKQ